MTSTKAKNLTIPLTLSELIHNIYLTRSRLWSVNGMKTLETNVIESSPYLSPKDLQERWRCSRTSVDRIARRVGLTRFCLGQGRNGIVRYSRKEVEAFEAKRQA